jgi:hypothetical protein
MIDAGDAAGVGSDADGLVCGLLALTSHQTGNIAVREDLLSRCRLVSDAIATVVPAGWAGGTEVEDPVSAHAKELDHEWAGLLDGMAAKDVEALRLFFTHNEHAFRGHLLPTHTDLCSLYADLDRAAKDLVRALKEDFDQCLPHFAKPIKSTTRTRVASCGLSFEYHDNILCSKNKPAVALASGDGEPSVGARARYDHPTDRRGQQLSNKYTTPSVTAAVDRYKAVADDGPRRVQGILQSLCVELHEHQVAVIQFSNWALIMQAASAHVTASKQKGWTLPRLVAFAEEPEAEGVVGVEEHEGHAYGTEVTSEKRVSMRVEGLTAWWMDRTDPRTRENDLNLDHLILLTAPNMSGKSTLMRSALVAALLANSGLFVPCSSAEVPRYDSFFLRATSYDIPSEGKSAFAIEMDDMHIVLRDSTAHSLIMVDEIGRGTSSRDGACLAGALLEALERVGVSGIFSSHLHEVLRLPLQLPDLVYKRMGWELQDGSVMEGEDSSAEVRWTYSIEDGVCEDSMALQTARAYHIPASIVARAAHLSAEFDCAMHGRNLPAPIPERADQADQAGRVEQVITEPEVVTRSYALEDLRDQLRTLAAEAGCDSQVHIVDHSVDPAASLAGTSCVYVLEILKPGRGPSMLYVGETDAVSERVRTHRRQTYAASEGYRVRVAVLRTRDKGTSRLLERNVIRSLKQEGYWVTSDSDGRHTNFGSVGRQ